jgi:hypothetical protein
MFLQTHSTNNVPWLPKARGSDGNEGLNQSRDRKGVGSHGMSFMPWARSDVFTNPRHTKRAVATKRARLRLADLFSSRTVGTFRKSPRHPGAPGPWLPAEARTLFFTEPLLRPLAHTAAVASMKGVSNPRQEILPRVPNEPQEPNPPQGPNLSREPSEPRTPNFRRGEATAPLRPAPACRGSRL